MAKILIVDDAIFMRKMLSDILIKEGHHIVAEGETAKESIELYGKHQPDLVTMDIVMPEIDGFDAVKAVRELVKRYPNAKILMISAIGQEAIIEEALDAGAKGYIIKPFETSDVVKEVSKILKKAAFIMGKEVTFSQKAALKELGTMASVNAAAALAKLSKKRVKITVPRVQILNVLEVPDVFGGGDQIVTVIFITIDKKISGALVLLLDQANALKLANFITEKNESALSEFAVSSLKECGNICLNSYVNIINKVTGIRVSTSVPEIATNQMKTVLNEVCTRSEIQPDRALVLETAFQLNSTLVFGHFLLYLKASSFEKILDGLTEYRKEASR